MKCIVSMMCRRILCRRCRWRYDLVNDGNRIWRGYVLIITCNDVGVRLLILRMSGGIGTARSMFFSGNAAGLWLFLTKRSLVGAY